MQNKVKSIDPKNIDLQPKEKSAYDVSADDRDIYDTKWFFKDIAPVIIAGNEIGGGYNDERDGIVKLLTTALEKHNHIDQFENVLKDIDDKAKRLNSSWGRMNADDVYRSLSATIHNKRGEPNEYFRELLKMLIIDMRKYKVGNLKEYFNKKFLAGIR